MKKNKTIFWLGALFFVLALAKYAFNAEQLSSGFIVFEILSFLVVLFMIYFVVNYMELCLKGTDDHRNRECVKRQNEIERLRAKLKVLETKQTEETEKNKNNGQAVVDRLKRQFKGYDKKSAVALVNELTQQYETMAAIAYCLDGTNYRVVKTYGIDEELELPAVESADGLHAQAIADNRALEIDSVPPDYIEVGSATGSTKPLYLYILPLIQSNKKGILLEVATFKKTNLPEVWCQFQSVQ
ncbi:hypothetical protein [Carboxylicivirga taeanensis]|uniref:hypothetical protein n=1 Tax=Carboxylicivirga taeanensis TaxID=1416875 RepID=UPI003F6E181A